MGSLCAFDLVSWLMVMHLPLTQAIRQAIPPTERWLRLAVHLQIRWAKELLLLWPLAPFSWAIYLALQTDLGNLVVTGLVITSYALSSILAASHPSETCPGLDGRLLPCSILISASRFSSIK